jgi:hypothetical protein
MKPITGIIGCCARVPSGHAAAEPAITLMKSRRLIAASKRPTTAHYQKSRIVHCSKLHRGMTVVGH